MKKSKKSKNPKAAGSNPNGAGRSWFDGRPEDMVVSKLKDAFSIGANVTRACAHAGILRQTYYEYLKIHPELTDTFERLQLKPILKAEANIAEKLNQGDIEISKWLLERRAKEDYSSRQEIAGPSLMPVEISPEKKARIMALLKKNRNEK